MDKLDVLWKIYKWRVCVDMTEPKKKFDDFFLTEGFFYRCSRGCLSSKRRKRRGAVEDEIELEESTSTHILSSGPIMIKETETETEERDEGGMTYGQLNMLTVVLSEKREGCPQIPNCNFPSSPLYSYWWK